MKEVDLYNIKLKSGSAHKYMKLVLKKYLKGNTIIDKKRFIGEFKKSHSQEEIILLYNELKADKENDMTFTSGIFGITIPIYIALITFVSTFFISMLDYAGNLSLKSMDILIEDFNKQKKASNTSLDLEPALNIFKSVGKQVVKEYGKVIIIVLFLILCVYMYNYFLNNHRKGRYLALISSVKDLYELER